jgi:putative addiction module component (TIGR02574 family)
MDLEALSREALALPVQARAKLAEQLLSSLDALSDEENEQLWFQEAARRAEELGRGSAKRISAEDVQREVRALLK